MSRSRPLVELEPEWILPGRMPCLRPAIDERCATRHLSREQVVASGEEPIGIAFWCPACDPTHRIAIPMSACPPGQNWLGGADAPRWDGAAPADRDPAKLTISPSIDCSGSGSCTFHGWIRGGVVTW